MSTVNSCCVREKEREREAAHELRRWSGCQGGRVMEMEKERTNQSGCVLLTRGQSGVLYSHGCYCDRHRKQTRQQAA